MIKVLFFLLTLTTSAYSQTAVYPCDITPAPVLCYGQKKMLSAYAGSAIDVYNPNTGLSTTIGYSGDNLDTTALDAFLAGDAGNVTKWYEQKNSKHLVQPLTPTTGNTTINSGVITNIGSLSGASVKKMILGPGIDFNSTVASIDSADQVTMTEVATATATGVPIAFSSAPHISTLTIGNSRALIFQGDSTLGAFDYMYSLDISSLNITAKDYTVTIVVLPSSSMYSNQAGSPDVSLGALFDLVAAEPVILEGTITSGSPIITGLSSTADLDVGDVVGGINTQIPLNAAIATVNSLTQVTLDQNANNNATASLTFARPVARAYNNANSAVRGAWSISDGSGFDFIPDTSWVQTNPTVLSITSDATGVKLWQDGQIRATSSRSGLTRTAAYFYLGKLANSMPGAFGRGFGGEIVSAIVHDVGLTQAQQAILASSLWTHFGLNTSISKFATNLVTLFGDSIPASYKTLGTYGYIDYLRETASLPARYQNLAVAGSTCSQNPAGGPSYANTTGLFPLAGAPVLTATNANKGRIAIFHLGGNDTFGPTQRIATTNGTTTIAVADTSNLTVGDYVFSSGISTLTTITNIDPNVSITVDVAPSGSEVVLLQFIYSTFPPSAIYDCISSLVTAANIAGATKSIVSTILPRNSFYTPWYNEINTLIVGGIDGSTVVNCATYGILATNPGPAYADAAHLTTLGHQTMAECLLSEVNSGLIE